MTRIAIDAMGGDRAPGPEVAGAVAAVRRADAAGDDLTVVLVGDSAALTAELGRLGAGDHSRIEVVHASQAVTMDDAAAVVYRRKPDSSLRVGLELCARGEAEALVSAGNSGAVLSHAVFALGRLPGVDRPGIAAVFPIGEPDPGGAGQPGQPGQPDASITPGEPGVDARGKLVLCDMGANVDVKPRALAQFGILGACYDHIAHGRVRPRVGVLSNGTEPSKGTELTRAADAILCAAARTPGAEFEYVGYVEGTSLFSGDIDVVATDGFTGNVVLKLAEGLADAFVRMVERLVAGELAAAPRGPGDGAPALAALSRMKAAIDHAETGGVPLLGVRGVVTICHGNSDAVAIENATRAAAEFARAGLTERLGRAIARQAALFDQ